MKSRHVRGTDVRVNWGQILNEVQYGGTIIVITKWRKPACAIVPISYLKELEKLDKERKS